MVFTVKSPIPGFAHIKTMELTKIDDFFMKLQSEQDDTSFTLINPFLLRPYEFDIPTAYKELLAIDEKSELLVLNIMIISTPIEKSAINFIAPLVFNTTQKCMAQIMLDTIKYPHFGITESISNFLNTEEA